MDYSWFLRNFQNFTNDVSLDVIDDYARRFGFLTRIFNDGRQIIHQDGNFTAHSELYVLTRSGQIREGIAFARFRSVSITQDEGDDLISTYLAETELFPEPISRKRLRGSGMYDYDDSNDIPIYPHFAPGLYYRDKSGQLKDDEGHNLKEMDGIAFDNDANVIGYDPKVYPVPPTQLQIQQAKNNILTDHMMNAHEIIHNYESPPIPRKHIRTTRNVNKIGTRHASDWEIDEYIRNYKEPGI